MSEVLVHAGLFLAALAAATILPLQSEALLVALLLTGDYSPWLLVAVASCGNILGSAVNWLLGRWLERLRDRSWFPVRAPALERARRWYHRYGRWSLLLSWVPVIGDPLTVIAGVLREPFVTFIGIVAVAKIGRYIALAVTTASVA